MKQLLTIAVMVGMASLCFGIGGEVDFENFSNSLIYTNSVHNGPPTGLISGPPGVVNPFQPGAYIFALFSAPTNQITVDASLSGWTLETADGVNTATPGLMNGNDDQSGPGATLAISPTGLPRNFLVVGWSANIGDNWGLASGWWNNGNPNSGPSGYFAISGIAQDVVVGGSVFPIPTIFGPTPGYEIQGFTLNLYTIPEPSTSALAGFGVTALLALRRRKSAKALLAMAVMVGAASLSFAQGIVDYENFSNSLIYTNSVHNGPSTGLITGNHAYYFALLEGETNATTIDASLDNGTTLANGGWIFSGNLATNTATPGLINGNYTTDPGVLVEQTSGDPFNFVVVGWSANIGTTYAEAKTWWNNGNPNSGPSGYFAISDIASNVVVGGNPYPVPTIFGPTPGYEIQGFTLNLYTIPEPSTFALAGFGVAGLIALRRRR